MTYFQYDDAEVKRLLRENGKLVFGSDNNVKLSSDPRKPDGVMFGSSGFWKTDISTKRNDTKMTACCYYKGKTDTLPYGSKLSSKESTRVIPTRRAPDPPTRKMHNPATKEGTLSAFSNPNYRGF